ncbi:MAG TPA: hypothetical protein VGS58_04650 [Candidatus Sulfopaludibacter sp.]|nr:hypothetical protein [Candidatus Sulfopaludibacter sp.]
MVAEKLGLTSVEIDRVASAFEHADLEEATSAKAATKVRKSHRER